VAPKKKTAKKAAPIKPAAKRTKSAKKGKRVVAATAADILGLGTPKKNTNSKAVPARKPAVIKRKWRKYYDMLLDRRDRLLHQMGDLKKESAEEMPSYSMHMADAGTDNFDRDSALSLLSSDQDAIYEIEEALKRIEKHTFGVCELTGKAIPKTRLNAKPWARYTASAQAQLEKDGAVTVARKLGNLGTLDGAGATKLAVSDSLDSETKTTKSKA
jgi:RNA polymerase-binding transcription factor DksA